MLLPQFWMGQSASRMALVTRVPPASGYQRALSHEGYSGYGHLERPLQPLLIGNRFGISQLAPNPVGCQPNILAEIVPAPFIHGNAGRRQACEPLSNRRSVFFAQVIDTSLRLGMGCRQNDPGGYIFHIAMGPAPLRMIAHRVNRSQTGIPAGSIDFRQG